MNLNYAAFTFAVINGCLPEAAFAKIEKDIDYHASDYAGDMKILKTEFTWREVGELFGISEMAAYRTVLRHCN